MCRRCSSHIAEELNQQLNDLEAECLTYKTALDDLVLRRNSLANSSFDVETARRKLAGLEFEEKEMLEQLAALEKEESSLSAELTSKTDEKRALADQDEELYRQLRDNHAALIKLADEQRGLKAQAKYANEQLQRLQRINHLDAAFFIWIDGDYGTINGLR